MLSFIEVNADNVRHNIESLKGALPNKKIIAVVKANAYGIGVREVVPILEDHVDVFAVDDVEELHSLRFLTEKPVYMLGYVPHEDLERVIDMQAVPTVYDIETLREIEKHAYARKISVPVNIKIDAQLGRQGLTLETLDEMVAALKLCSHVDLHGVYAHFANIEDTKDFSHAQKQIDYYKNACQMFESAGFEHFEKHISSTAGSLVYDATADYCSHVRLGIGLYGLWPSEHVHEDTTNITLKPVATWKTKVAQVKNLPKGHSIGYGLSHILERDSVVAVIPQGYSDGYDRKLSNTADVLIHGQRCPAIGRVAMNMFVVDVTDIDNVQQEDEVVLLGCQADEEITAEELSDIVETVNYEIIARLSPLLPRVVMGTDL